MSNKITVYHGSPKIIEKPAFGVGNPQNDYGLGFYCTESVELAKEWACSVETDGFANQYMLKVSKHSSSLYQEIGDKFGYVLKRGKVSLTKVATCAKEEEENE